MDQGGRAGVSSLAFSACGSWLLSTAKELCIWRVVCPAPPRGQLSLQLHERVAPVGTAEAIRVAAFCEDDALILGTFDGLLNLWLKRRGAPERLLPQPPTSPASRRTRSAEGGPTPTALERLPRPLNRVLPADPFKLRPPSRPPVQVGTHVRPLTESHLPLLRMGSRNPSPDILQDFGHTRRPQSHPEGTPRRRLPKPASAHALPGVGGLWKARNFEMSDLYSGPGGLTHGRKSTSTTSLPSALDNSTAWRSPPAVDASPRSKALGGSSGGEQHVPRGRLGQGALAAGDRDHRSGSRGADRGCGLPGQRAAALGRPLGLT